MDVDFIHLSNDFFKQRGVHDVQELLALFKHKAALQGACVIVQVLPLAVSSHQQQRRIGHDRLYTIYQIAEGVVGIQVHDHSTIGALFNILLRVIQLHADLVQLCIGMGNADGDGVGRRFRGLVAGRWGAVSGRGLGFISAGCEAQGHNHGECKSKQLFHVVVPFSS